MQQTSRCPNCGSPTAFGQRFCGSCGTTLSTSCPYCGTPASPGARFCPNCGAAVGGEGPQQQPGWGPQQQPGWGPQQPGPQQPGWGPQQAPRGQRPSSSPLLLVLLVVLLLGLGSLIYWQFGDYLLGFFSSSTTTADTTAPKITNVVDSTDNTSAIITWSTDEPASSQVEYGTTTSYGSLSPSTPQNDPSAGTSLGVVSHSVTLTGLDSVTEYHYKVKSKDKAGNLAVSPDKAFTAGSSSE